MDAWSGVKGRCLRNHVLHGWGICEQGKGVASETRPHKVRAKAGEFWLVCHMWAGKRGSFIKPIVYWWEKGKVQQPCPIWEGKGTEFQEVPEEGRCELASLSCVAVKNAVSERDIGQTIGHVII